MGESNRRDDDLDVRTKTNWAGQADAYVDEDGSVVPKKSGLVPFMAWALVAVAGVYVASRDIDGAPWFFIAGFITSIVGLVGASQYKYATQALDVLIVLAIGAIVVTRLYLRYV